MTKLELIKKNEELVFTNQETLKKIRTNLHAVEHSGEASRKISGALWRAVKDIDFRMQKNALVLYQIEKEKEKII